MTYDPSTDSLSSLLVMSGTELGSNHLVTTLKRAGAAPVVSDTDMPGHGANFSCEFWEGGRDSVPVNQSTAPASLRVLSTDDNAHKQVKSSACPYLSRKLVSESPSTTSDKTQRTMNTSPHNKPVPKRHTSSSLDYAHCYSLNNAAGYHVQWTLDKDNSLLHVAVSAPSVSGPGTYVAIGFRPLSRSSANELVRRGSGSHMNFGMQGADIVTGSVSLGVKQYYAELYTGAPVSSIALDLTNASVVFDTSTNRTVLYFTRPLVSGHLAKVYNMSASILSPFADVLWAVGAEGAAMCDYHYNTRGMRAIDWEEPEIAMPEEWKC